MVFSEGYYRGVGIRQTRSAFSAAKICMSLVARALRTNPAPQSKMEADSVLGNYWLVSSVMTLDEQAPLFYWQR
jgi:hypothetical protein